MDKKEQKKEQKKAAEEVKKEWRLYVYYLITKSS